MATVGEVLFSKYDMKPTRIMSTMAKATRMVQYPDGRQAMQGAYEWHEGFTSGFEWRDLPIVLVNVFGQESIGDE